MHNDWYGLAKSFFSFPQKEAIDWAWDLLTRVYKVPKERLYVTYFGGNKDLNLDPDEEVRQIWLDMGQEVIVTFNLTLSVCMFRVYTYNVFI